jgi:Uma2 family endonuclease
MSTTTKPTAPEEIEYPDSDGEPMAENTLQWEWIVTIKSGFDAVFFENPDVFVASDLFWYPVEGDNKTRLAPDVMVAFGRPKGYRGSYMQWREGRIAPQVVFEILSPGNRAGELARKFQFYEHFGVEEYYIYDPDDNTLQGWLREGGTLGTIPEMNGWVSPRLGVRFELVADQFRLCGPDGRPFPFYTEAIQDREGMARRNEELIREREMVTRQNEELIRERDMVARRNEELSQRAAHLAAKLKALGIDPEE